jgi:hypothetical protein
MRRQWVLAALVVIGLAATWTGGTLGQPARTCLELTPTIIGDGSGIIYGTGGADVIAHAYDVPETIYGFGGNDVICVGHGDTVYAGSGNDLVGIDIANETTFDDAIVYGGAGDDEVQGGNPVYGESGNDVLSGSGYVFGGAGNDRFVSGSICNGGSGTDTVDSVATCPQRQNIP